MGKISRRRFLQASGSGAAVVSLLASQDLGLAQVVKEIHKLKPGEFTWNPDRSPAGPLSIIVSLPDQLVHVYRNGIRIAVSTCSTGKAGHETPTGVFTILQKDKDHHSSTYNNAPMPNMNRLTWSGVALHAGKLPGYPASHGCVRLPGKFSELLFSVTHVDTPVIIAGGHSQPEEASHPGIILGEYASHEFDTVTKKLREKELPWAAEIDNFSGAVSLLVSSADKRAILLVDGAVIKESPVTIVNQYSPLGNHVFMLVDAHTESQGMAWHAIGHHEKTGVPLGQPEAGVITRITMTDDMRDLVHDHMHPGMVLVTTDLPAHPHTRSNEDFVVLSQAVS